MNEPFGASGSPIFYPTFPRKSWFDYPVAMAVLFVTIVLTLIGYLLSDILYTVVDPRIQLS